MVSCNCDQPNDSSGFTSGFFLGLVLGGAGGYLLTTDKGQELLNQLKEAGGDKLKEITENPAIADKLADLEKTVEQARAALEKGSDSARSQFHQAAEQVSAATAPPAPPSKRTFFRRGNPLK